MSEGKRDDFVERAQGAACIGQMIKRTKRAKKSGGVP